MSIYGSNIFSSINESASIEKTITESISIVFDEYCNYCKLLENCTSEEYPILEAKVQVLQEVSFKDIGQGIVKIIKRIIKFISDAIDKIKGFFTKAKQKELEKKCAELEKALKESEANKIKFENKYKDKSAEFDSMKKLYQDELDKEKNNSSKLSELEGDKEQLNAKNAKLSEENERLRVKLKEVGERIISNDLLYFNAYDYFDKNIDPAKVVNSMNFDNIMSFDYKYSQSSEEIREYFAFCVDKISKRLDFTVDKIKKLGDLSDRGYNYSEIDDIIVEDIKNAPRYKSYDDLMNRVKWLSNGYQVSAMEQTLAKLKDLSGKIETMLVKMFNYNGNSEIFNNGQYSQIMTEQVKAIKAVLDIIENDCQLVALLANYAGRAVGAATQAIIVLTSIYGMEKPKY